ncbi:MAG TPA: 23S rRNA (guanosine(2251)-2'-O)-methyltransferase RlmB [Acidimicrobiia bacterium]|nr:23S rRNA (guanosine(2251)-2'-O)-methyltransferase RlmB [Acidimicrobiia bacterium]
MSRRRGAPQVRRTRDDLGGEQVEGRRAVRELLDAGRRRVRSVTIADLREPSPVLDELADLAAAHGIRVRRVEPERLAADARTEAPQGVVARADPLVPAALDDLLAQPDAFLVSLDGVTDPQNLGAVLRTAETAGATGAVLPRHRGALLTPAAVKAAAGAVEHLPIALVSGVPHLLERASRAGVWTVGLDAGAPASVFDLEVADRPVVLVLGAEGRGLSRLTRKRCDVVASIPMRGRIGSLNVAAAAAVACFEVVRRRGPRPGV